MSIELSLLGTIDKKIKNAYNAILIAKSIIEKSGSIIALRRLYGILLIRCYVRLSIMKNARHMLLHVDHGKWLLYTAKRMDAFILL